MAILCFFGICPAHCPGKSPRVNQTAVFQHDVIRQTQVFRFFQGALAENQPAAAQEQGVVVDVAKFFPQQVGALLVGEIRRSRFRFQEGMAYIKCPGADEIEDDKALGFPGFQQAVMDWYSVRTRRRSRPLLSKNSSRYSTFSVQRRRNSACSFSIDWRKSGYLNMGP